MKKVLTVVGTRPNFIKITQFHNAFGEKSNLEHKLLHTGQHFDKNMSDVFFDELKIPEPNYHLGVTSNSVVGQQADIMLGLEKVFNEYKPDLVNVVGDVNSTFSAAFTAQKMGIKIAHIESGLRSNDMSMPEEVNRILTDSITDYFFVTEQSGLDNLQQDGYNQNMYLVGNTMLDTQKKFLAKALNTEYHSKLDVKSKEYILLTLHRPSNVDDLEKLKQIMDDLLNLTNFQNVKLVYPIHPRTKKSLEKLGYLNEFNKLNKLNNQIILCDP